MASGDAGAASAATLMGTTLAAVTFPLAAAFSLGGSFLLVSRLERLAGRVRLSEAALGLVVALAADSPEITSAVTASSNGQRGIGVGVVLGSNVFNLAALLGLGAIVAGRVRLHRRVVILDGVTATWVAVVCAVVVAAHLGAVVGLVLTLVVVLPYIAVSALKPATLGTLGLPSRALAWVCGTVEEAESEIAEAIHPSASGHADFATALASLLVVVAASAAMERSATTLGSHFHLTGLVVGGLVLAGVTSLPNAVGAVFLASRGRGAAVLSEAMNSNTLNVVVGLFLPGLFIGLGRQTGSGTLVASWCACLTVVSLLTAFAGRGLGRTAGAAIVAGYLAFVAVAIAS